MPGSSVSQVSTCHLCHLHNHAPDGLVRTSPLRHSRSRSKYSNKPHRHHSHHHPHHRSHSRDERIGRSTSGSALARLSDHCHSLPASRSNSLTRYHPEISILPDGRDDYNRHIRSNASTHSLEINPPITSLLDARTSSLPRGLTTFNSTPQIHPEPDLLVNAIPPRSRAGSRAGTLPRTPGNLSQDNSHDYYLHFDRQRYKGEKKKQRFNLQTVMLIGCYSLLVVIAIIVGVVVCYQNGWLGLGPPLGFSGDEVDTAENAPDSNLSRIREKIPGDRGTNIQGHKPKLKTLDKISEPQLPDTKDVNVANFFPTNSVSSSGRPRDIFGNTNAQLPTQGRDPANKVIVRTSGSQDGNLNQRQERPRNPVHTIPSNINHNNQVRRPISGLPTQSNVGFPSRTTDRERTRVILQNTDVAQQPRQPLGNQPGFIRPQVRNTPILKSEPPKLIPQTPRPVLDDDPTVFKFKLPNNRGRPAGPIPSANAEITRPIQNVQIPSNVGTQGTPFHPRRPNSPSGIPTNQNVRNSNDQQSFDDILRFSTSQVPSLINNRPGSSLAQRPVSSPGINPVQRPASPPGSNPVQRPVSPLKSNPVQRPVSPPGSNPVHRPFSPSTEESGTSSGGSKSSQTLTTQELLNLLAINHMRELLRSEGDAQNFLEMLQKVGSSPEFRLDSITQEGIRSNQNREKIGPFVQSRQGSGRSIARDPTVNQFDLTQLTRSILAAASEPKATSSLINHSTSPKVTNHGNSDSNRRKDSDTSNGTPTLNPQDGIFNITSLPNSLLNLLSSGIFSNRTTPSVNPAEIPSVNPINISPTPTINNHNSQSSAKKPTTISFVPLSSHDLRAVLEARRQNPLSPRDEDNRKRDLQLLQALLALDSKKLETLDRNLSQSNLQNESPKIISEASETIPQRTASTRGAATRRTQQVKTVPPVQPILRQTSRIGLAQANENLVTKDDGAQRPSTTQPIRGVRPELRQRNQLNLLRELNNDEFGRVIIRDKEPPPKSLNEVRAPSSNQAKSTIENPDQSPNPELPKSIDSIISRETTANVPTNEVKAVPPTAQSGLNRPTSSVSQSPPNSQASSDSPKGSPALQRISSDSPQNTVVPPKSSDSQIFIRISEEDRLKLSVGQGGGESLLTPEEEKILSQGINKAPSNPTPNSPDPSFSILVRTVGRPESPNNGNTQSNTANNEVSSDLPRASDREVVAVQPGSPLFDPSVIRTWTHMDSQGTLSRGQVRSDGSFSFTNCKPVEACNNQKPNSAPAPPA